MTLVAKRLAHVREAEERIDLPTFTVNPELYISLKEYLLKTVFDHVATTVNEQSN